MYIYIYIYTSNPEPQEILQHPALQGHALTNFPTLT